MAPFSYISAILAIFLDEFLYNIGERLGKENQYSKAILMVYQAYQI